MSKFLGLSLAVVIPMRLARGSHTRRLRLWELKEETKMTNRLVLIAALLLAGCGGTDPGTMGTPGPLEETGGAGSVGGDTAAGGKAEAVTSAGGATVIANPLCVPGASVACVGAGACSGGQVCKADGSGYEECACETPQWACTVTPPSLPGNERCDCKPGIASSSQVSLCPANLGCCFLASPDSCFCKEAAYPGQSCAELAGATGKVVDSCPVL